MCLLICLCYAQRVSAHPHTWVDMKAEIVLDEEGRLAAITQYWAFDTYFSTVTLSDVVTEYGDKEIGLTKKADQIIRNLAEYQYFSSLTIDGSEIELLRPSAYQLTESDYQDTSILELEMRIDMNRPLVIKDKILAWSVFDPTYYIAMNYSDVENISIQGEKSAQCQMSLDLPKPSLDLVDYAQNLDRSRKDTDGLGVNFAEKLLINCTSGLLQ